MTISSIITNFEIAMRISHISVISIGMLGNILSFIVFSRKTFRKNSISTYCRALAVFDCLSIIQLVSQIDRYLENKSDVNCKLFYYLSIEYTAIPPWILVAFSIDKMLNMKTSTPNILKSKLFQWSVVAAIVIFHLLLYSELLISVKLEPVFFLTEEVQICNFQFLSYLNTFIYAELADTCIIPFVIMILSSIVTIRLLMRSRKSLERFGNRNNVRRRRDIKYSISSLVFNFLFLAFKTPFFVSYLLPETAFFNNYFYTQLAFLLFMINCSSNFFIHLTTNSIFRREICIIVRVKTPANRVSPLILHNSRQK